MTKEMLCSNYVLLSFFSTGLSLAEFVQCRWWVSTISWRDDTDRGKRNASDKRLSQWCFSAI